MGKDGAFLPLSYAPPFSTLIYNYLIAHPNFYDDLYENYGAIDYNVSSQTFGEDKKYILYPIVKEGVVTAMWYGILKEDRTWVDFYLVNDKSPFTRQIMAEFQMHYSKAMVGKTVPDPPVVEIEEVIIYAPEPIPTFPVRPEPDNGGSGGHDYGGDMSGGSEVHNGGGGIQAPKANPCDKIKANKANPEVKSKLAELKSFSHDLNGEKSFKIRPDGTTSPVSQSSTNHIDPGDYTGYSTAIHSHPRRKIQMFSPDDIRSFLTLALYQGVGNQGDALDGMVGSTVCSACTDTNNSHYYEFYMNFTGTYQELVDAYNNLNAQNFKDIDKKYQKLYSNYDTPKSPYYDADKETVSNVGLQKFFFDILNDLGLSNKVTLQTVDKNGNIKKFNSNDQENGTNCN